MKPVYDYGDEVRLMRNVRNDGTYPGLDTGAPLISRGSVGHVQSVGTYLQDYIIYSVHFLEQDILVGCKEEELIPADAPWVPSKYEFRDKVIATIPLAIKGEVIANEGDKGEVLKVLRDLPGGVQYHVRFPGRTLQVPESALDTYEDM
ncbi:MAG: nitrogen fixation protein NifZ [Gammaproteobacteria bacterium]